MSKIEVLAFYLPQFYPFKENNEWWGPGFTEWTNVAKAKPLFKGHNQPRIPADLGYYDLRVEETREQQVELAKRAGVTAFCYWHYWFGNGKRLLYRVFDEVLYSGKPDFPFCLGWANHSWYAKTWNKDSKDKLLIEQTYPGVEDAREHFNYLLRAFKDSRYLKIDGKPYLFIFDPTALPDSYIKMFNEWAIANGYPGLYLVANISPYEDKEEYIRRGYTAVLINRVSKATLTKNDIRKRALSNAFKDNRVFQLLLKIRRSIIKRLNPSPTIVDYRDYYKSLITEQDYESDVIPQLVPQWDHTPRSGINGLAWTNTTPSLFYNHACMALDAVKHKKNPIIVLKSWNEWGEGNYMEPDTVFGHGYIDALKKAIDDKSSEPHDE
jgi:hypothetical protein